jgi:hypothetical protein
MRLEGHSSGEPEVQHATSHGCDGGICEPQDSKLPPPVPNASREVHPTFAKERGDLPLFNRSFSSLASSSPFNFDPLFESDPPDEPPHV